jgi:hypothetical protein
LNVCLFANRGLAKTAVASQNTVRVLAYILRGYECDM